MNAEQIEQDRFKPSYESVAEDADARWELLKRLKRVSDGIEKAYVNAIPYMSFDLVGPLGGRERVLLGGALRIRVQHAHATHYAGQWVLCGLCLESRQEKVFPVMSVERIEVKR